MATIYEQRNDEYARLDDTQDRDIGGGETAQRLRAWRVYGNIETVHDGESLIVRPARTGAVNSQYAIPLPEDNAAGAGFCEIAVPPNTRIAADVSIAATSATTWASLFWRSGISVQWFVITAAHMLIVRRDDGDGVEVSENLGALPESDAGRWHIAFLSGASGQRILIRAAERSHDPRTWVVYRPEIAALPSAPTWAGFSVASQLSSTADAQLRVHGWRIQRPAIHARRWTAFADVPGDPAAVAEQLQRKNRVTAVATWSRDSEARAGSDKTLAGYTPTVRL